MALDDETTVPDSDLPDRRLERDKETIHMERNSRGYRDLARRVLAGGMSIAMAGAFIAPAPGVIEELAGHGTAQSAYAEEAAPTRDSVQKQITELSAKQKPAASDVTAVIDSFGKLGDADRTALQGSCDAAVGAAAGKVVAALGDNSRPEETDVSDVTGMWSKMNAAQRARVTGYDATVSAATTRAANWKAAKPVQEALDALAGSDRPTPDAIENVEDAHDALTDDQADMLDGYSDKTSKARVLCLQNALKDLAANESPSSDDLDAVDSIHDMLTESELSQVGDYDSTVQAAEARKQAADQKAAQAVTDRFAGIISASNPSDQEISDAAEAYEALSDDQKELVTNYDAFHEVQLDRLDKYVDQAAPVQELVDDLLVNEDPRPEDVTATVDAYNALPRMAQQAVANYDAAVSLARQAIQDGQQKVAAVQAEAAALGNPPDAAATATARSHYDLLTPYQRELAGDAAIVAIEDAEARLAGRPTTTDKRAAAPVVDAVSKLAALQSPTQADIDSVKALYDALAPSQKTLVTEYASTVTVAQNLVDTARGAAVFQEMLDSLSANQAPTEADVQSVEDAYDALTADQKKAVQGYAQTIKAAQGRVEQAKRANDKKAASQVQALVDALAGNMSPTRADIDAVMSAYGILTSDQKKLVSNYQGALDTAEGRIAAKADAADKAAAKPVSVAVKELSGKTRPTGADISAVTGLYDALTQAQKNLVPDYARTVAAANAKIADWAAVDPVQAQVNALAANLAPTQADIDAVKQAYAGLTDTQKDLVTGLGDSVKAADKRIADSKTAKQKADAEAAQPVATAVADLSTTTRPTEKQVKDVKGAYSLLTSDQKKLVPGYSRAVAAAEGRIADWAAVDPVQAKVDALLANTAPTQDDIDEVNAAYAKLSTTRQDLVKRKPEAIATAQRLIAAAKTAKGQADLQAAQPVVKALADLTGAKRPTAEKADAVEAAYGKLTDDQKRLVPGFESGIKAARQLIADWEAADGVQEKVDALAQNAAPSQADIDAVNQAYAGLTRVQQDLVHGKTDAVTSAMRKIAAQGKSADEADKAAAAGVVELAKQLSNNPVPTQADIDAVQNAYGKLTDAQKKKVLGYDEIIRSAESRIKHQQDQASDAQVRAVQALVDALIVNPDPSQADIDAVKTAYSKLSRDQQSQVGGIEQAYQVAAKKVEDKQAAADQKAADSVTRMVQDLAWKDQPSSADVKVVKDAYGNLTDAQKKRVKEYDQIVAAVEQAIAKRDAAKTVADQNSAAASAFEAKLKALDAMDAPSKDDIDAVEDAYNELTDDQKRLVEGYQKSMDSARDKEQAAEERASDEQAKADAQAAQAVRDILSNLAKQPTSQGIVDATTAYESLTDGQKAMVVEFADVIGYAQQKVMLQPAYAVQDMVTGLAKSKKPRQKKIDSVKNAYTALTSQQRKVVSKYKATVKSAQKRHDAAYAKKGVTVNVKSVTATSLAAELARQDRPDSVVSASRVTKLTLGAKTRKVGKGALAKMKKATDLVVKSGKVKFSRGALKGSKVKTVKVQVSKSKKKNAKYVEKYRKALAKAKSGKSVKVK